MLEDCKPLTRSLDANSCSPSVALFSGVRGGRGGGGKREVLPIMACTRRLYPKGYLFQASGI